MLSPEGALPLDSRLQAVPHVAQPAAKHRLQLLHWEGGQRRRARRHECQLLLRPLLLLLLATAANCQHGCGISCHLVIFPFFSRVCLRHLMLTPCRLCLPGSSPKGAADSGYNRLGLTVTRH